METAPPKRSPRHCVISSSHSNIDGVDCDINDMFKEVVAALYDVGFTKQEQDDVFALLAGILHLGNLQFTAKVGTSLRRTHKAQ